MKLSPCYFFTYLFFALLTDSESSALATNIDQLYRRENTTTPGTLCTDGHEILTQHCTIYIRPSILLFYPLQVQYEHASTGHLRFNVKYTTKLFHIFPDESM